MDRTVSYAPRVRTQGIVRHYRAQWAAAGDRLMFDTVDGDLWWTNGYMMAKVTDPGLELLRLYNLPWEPMVCSASTQYVTRIPTREPAELVKLVEQAVPLHVVTAERRARAEVRIVGADGRHLVPYESASELVHIDVRYRDFCEAVLGDGGWWTTGQGAAAVQKPVVYASNADDVAVVLALVMPVRVE